MSASHSWESPEARCYIISIFFLHLFLFSSPTPQKFVGFRHFPIFPSKPVVFLFKHRASLTPCFDARSIHSAATCMVLRIGPTEWVSGNTAEHRKAQWSRLAKWSQVDDFTTFSSLKFWGLETRKGWFVLFLSDIFFSPWFMMVCAIYGVRFRFHVFSGGLFLGGRRWEDRKSLWFLYLTLPCWVGMR